MPACAEQVKAKSSETFLKRPWCHTAMTNHSYRPQTWLLKHEVTVEIELWAWDLRAYIWFKHRWFNISLFDLWGKDNTFIYLKAYSALLNVWHNSELRIYINFKVKLKFICMHILSASMAALSRWAVNFSSAHWLEQVIVITTCEDVFFPLYSKRGFYHWFMCIHLFFSFSQWQLWHTHGSVGGTLRGLASITGFSLLEQQLLIPKVCQNSQIIR